MFHSRKDATNKLKTKRKCDRRPWRVNNPIDFFIFLSDLSALSFPFHCSILRTEPPLHNWELRHFLIIRFEWIGLVFCYSVVNNVFIENERLFQQLFNSIFDAHVDGSLLFPSVTSLSPHQMRLYGTRRSRLIVCAIFIACLVAVNVMLSKVWMKPFLWTVSNLWDVREKSFSFYQIRRVIHLTELEKSSRLHATLTSAVYYPSTVSGWTSSHFHFYSLFSLIPWSN